MNIEGMAWAYNCASWSAVGVLDNWSRASTLLTEALWLLPAACRYYAHLAAFRGRVLLGEADSGSETSGMSAAPVFSNVHPNIENMMYYA